MSRRPIMFVPSGFTIDENTIITFENCRLIQHLGWDLLNVDMYKEHFQGQMNLEGLDICTQDDPEAFINKIQSFISQED